MTDTVAESSFSSVLNSNKDDLAKIKNYESMPITTKARNLAFVGMAGGSVLMAGMFAAQILSGIFALVTTIGFAGACFFGLRFLRAMDPAIQQKTRNFRLKVMYEEAQKNAIYQLDNLVIDRSNRLKAASEARVQVGGLIRKLEREVKDTSTDSPFYAESKQMLDTVKDAAEKLDKNLAVGKAKLEEFEQKVTHYKRRNALAELAGKAMKIIGASSGDKLQEQLSLASFEAIDNSLDSALSSLEHSTNQLELA